MLSVHCSEAVGHLPNHAPRCCVVRVTPCLRDMNLPPERLLRSGSMYLTDGVGRQVFLNVGTRIGTALYIVFKFKVYRTCFCGKASPNFAAKWNKKKEKEPRKTEHPQ